MIRLCTTVVLAILAATTAARAVDVEIVFLSRDQEERLPLSFVDPIVEDPGVWGARLALDDNKTTGGFLGHTYSLVERVLTADEDIAAVFEEERQSGRTLFISDLPRDDLQAIAEHPEASEALIFNGRVGDDDLRIDVCFDNVFHTAPSRSMRTDALVQFLVWKRWPRLYLVSGTQENDLAFADAIRRSAEKFGAQVVAESDYAYSAISRRTDSGHIQIQDQMPLATQEGGEYDVLVVADENEVFGEYLPYNTYAARPVAGTAFWSSGDQRRSSAASNRWRTGGWKSATTAPGSEFAPSVKR